jgi:D-sedoheptulose 7-phosphate isomerase
MEASLTYSRSFLAEARRVIDAIDYESVEACVTGIASVRDGGGRLFVLGVGGSAAHASHAVNDFRKLCGVEAYAPTDNVSELTARVNDEGWEGVFADWLRVSRLRSRDGLLVFSVGGGDAERGVSVNLMRAFDLASERGASKYAVVGRDGGYAAKVCDSCVVIPPLVPERVTPHTEGICAVIWHLFVSHPILSASPTRWESLAGSNSRP